MPTAATLRAADNPLGVPRGAGHVERAALVEGGGHPRALNTALIKTADKSEFVAVSRRDGIRRFWLLARAFSKDDEYWGSVGESIDESWPDPAGVGPE